MVGNKLEQEILNLYNKDITGLYSINQIAGRLEKAYPYINKKVTGLIKTKILKKNVIGKAHLCSINLESDEAVFLLVLNEIKKKKLALEKDPKLVDLINQINELKKVLTIHLTLIVGKKLVFVLEDTSQRPMLEKSAKISSYDLEICSKQEFFNQMLEDKKILDNHTILFGYEKYYHYLKEIEPQLKIKYSPILK